MLSAENGMQSCAHPVFIQPFEGVKSGQNLNPGPKAQDQVYKIRLRTGRISHATPGKATCRRDPRAHLRKHRDFPLPYRKVQQSKDLPSVKKIIIKY